MLINLRVCLLFLLSITAFASPLFAQQSAPNERLAQAKELFYRGVKLLRAGDPERALEHFERSRKLAPSAKNTVNAAICLERLGRDDEALELYEEVLARFAEELDDEDRTNLPAVMRALRTRIGYLKLSSNVEGLVIVDGRPRGRLPFSTALRLLPGERVVRIVKDGYRTFERTIAVRRNASATLDAQLAPLAGLAELNVVASDHSPAQVFVDGKNRGMAPWTGAIKPGRHVVRLKGREFGSLPELVKLTPGQNLKVALRQAPLGPAQRILVQPPTASIRLGELELGRGDWSGRFPVGKHRLLVSEEGYFPSSLTLEVRAGSPKRPVFVSLDKDRNHPRWPKVRKWRAELGVSTGLLYAPSSSAGAERSCPANCVDGAALWGGQAGLDIEARHLTGFGAVLQGGLAIIEQDLTRNVFDSYAGGTVNYSVEENLTGQAGYAVLGGRFTHSVSAGFELSATAGAGVLLASFDGTVSGSARTDGPSVDVRPVGFESDLELAPLISTSLGLERRFSWLVGRLALGVWYVPTIGNAFSSAPLVVNPDCPLEVPLDSVGCVPNSQALDGETTHGPFWMLAPTLALYHPF